MRTIYYSIILGIGAALSIPAVILIIAYQRGKAKVDKIKVHMETFSKTK